MHEMHLHPCLYEYEHEYPLIGHRTLPRFGALRRFFVRGFLGLSLLSCIELRQTGMSSLNVGAAGGFVRNCTILGIPLGALLGSVIA